MVFGRGQPVLRALDLVRPAARPVLGHYVDIGIGGDLPGDEPHHFTGPAHPGAIPNGGPKARGGRCRAHRAQGPPPGGASPRAPPAGNSQPGRGRSLPKCGVKLATRAKRPVRPTPASRASRSTRQARGQSVHSESRASAPSLCRRRRPLCWLKILAAWGGLGMAAYRLKTEALIAPPAPR